MSGTRRVLIDRALAVAVARAGEPGGIRFTERQLYYELCRVLRPADWIPKRPRFTVAPAVGYPAFRAALDRFGAVPGLLSEAELAPRRAPAGRHTAEPDLFHYGLPRVLVCQRQEIAGMLRANGMPMESACPVFGLDELPLDPRLTAMMSTVDGTIYYLHDASPEALALGRTITAPPRVRVLPLGLRPRQAAAMHLVRGRGPEGRFAEVASVNPAMLLRFTHRLVRDVPADRPQWNGLRRARSLGFLTWPRR
ncbi:hypothetical protein [Amycolatopsis sp. GM8]|uniref:hypothetical protein n=1 Tax=Amycolatopsis sp. GM8 TaxID=2896530 RepID=UPI001F40CB2C|nr:hypothetical protein [Amycolatopsis sp. GM8]